MLDSLVKIPLRAIRARLDRAANKLNPEPWQVQLPTRTRPGEPSWKPEPPSPAPMAPADPS